MIVLKVKRLVHHKTNDSQATQLRVQLIQLSLLQVPQQMGFRRARSRRGQIKGDVKKTTNMLEVSEVVAPKPRFDE